MIHEDFTRTGWLFIPQFVFSSLHNNTRIFFLYTYFFRHNYNNTQLLYPWCALFFSWRYINNHECSVPSPGSSWSSWCCTVLYNPKNPDRFREDATSCAHCTRAHRYATPFSFMCGFDLLRTNSDRIFCSRFIGAWSDSSVFLTDNHRRPCSCDT